MALCEVFNPRAIVVGCKTVYGRHVGNLFKRKNAICYSFRFTKTVSRVVGRL